jgi:hypothetical protein
MVCVLDSGLYFSAKSCALQEHHSGTPLLRKRRELGVVFFCYLVSRGYLKTDYDEEVLYHNYNGLGCFKNLNSIGF